ncbi:hypothetical protein PtVF89_12320 [Legionella pneumophila]|uniref:Uncharacterized protein n=1 Tax=Legionella pneumophila TaxID=446 RepID=A0A2S6EYY4_LEGPN|nr:hypothetical protein BIZ52_05900 [Legionella pneumophila subsp. fraseri]APF05946.1 hypothetical protein BIZ51_06015 [Legionella pneumophila subsp. fraseri]KXB24124.1 hypothetical protein PtVF89_12320 [Legionella pneumophila]PPK30381.1 hypothetical protein C3928_06315 [Legionella pneumophila]
MSSFHFLESVQQLVMVANETISIAQCTKAFMIDAASMYGFDKQIDIIVVDKKANFVFLPE